MDEKVGASISETGSANVWLAYWSDWLRGYDSEIQMKFQENSRNARIFESPSNPWYVRIVLVRMDVIRLVIIYDNLPVWNGL